MMNNETPTEFRLNLKLGTMHVNIPIEGEAGLEGYYAFPLLQDGLDEARTTFLFLDAPISELFQEVAARLEGVLLLEIRRELREFRKRARVYTAQLEGNITASERKVIESYRDWALLTVSWFENLLSSMSSDT